MARFFKPLLGAVALAAATLTSTGAMAQSYAYNAQITIAAPKGSAAEAASKDKSKPTGVKFTGCAADVNVGSINIKNPDYLQFSVKYDAGKTAGQIGDVYLVLQDLSIDDDGSTLPTARYITVGRSTGGGFGSGLNGGVVLTPLGDLQPATIGTAGTVTPFLAAADNLGTGAQTELLFGGSVGLSGLRKGLWAATVIIAKPGAQLATAATTGMDGATSANTFLFGRPETWAAHDTTVFQLGTPLAVDATNLLADVDTPDADPPTVYATTASLTCQ